MRASAGKKIGQAVGGHFWDTLTLSHMQCFPRSLNCYSRYWAETPMCNVCDEAHSKSRRSDDKTIAYFSGCLIWSPWWLSPCTRLPYRSLFLNIKAQQTKRLIKAIYRHFILHCPNKTEQQKNRLVNRCMMH